MSPPKPRPRQATFLQAASDDIGRLKQDDPQLAVLALRKVKDLEARRVDGAPLENLAVTGDLTDCRKLYFGLGEPPSHRIVYRELDDSGDIEILEVVAVEAREELYAYLLAANRLGRLPQETKGRFSRLHQQVTRRRAQRRKK